MSTQIVDLVVVGWQCPYDDHKVFNKSIGVTEEFDEKEFYTAFAEKFRFDYYKIKDNDMNKAYCFFDGHSGEFIVWGVPLAAKCNDADVSDFEIKSWSKEELTEKKKIAKVFRDALPECIRPEGKPQIIIFSQYH